MNDPHVDLLVYRLEVAENFSFDRAPPIQETRQAFVARLRDAELHIDFLAHFSTEREARAHVQPFVDGWVTGVALDRGARLFWFVFDHSKLIDRRPDVGALAGTATAHFSARGTLRGTASAFFPPLPTFKSTPLIEVLHRWIEAARGGDMELAPAAANFVLTAVKTHVAAQNKISERGEAKARAVADALAVDPAILAELWTFATKEPDFTTARKISDPADIDRPKPPLPMPTRRRACEAMRLLTLQLGIWEADKSALKRLELSALPSLA